MLKKYVKIILMFISVISLASCGKLGKEGGDAAAGPDVSHKKAGYTSNELFGDAINKIESIEYLAFDENKIKISDKKICSKLSELLRSGSFTELDSEKKVEGMYRFDLYNGNQAVSLGITDDIVMYEGKQYRTDVNLLFKELKKTCKI